MKDYTKLIPLSVYNEKELPEKLTVHVTHHDAIFGIKTTTLYHFDLNADGKYVFNHLYEVMPDGEFKAWAEKYHAETLEEIQTRGNGIIELLKVA